MNKLRDLLSDSSSLTTKVLAQFDASLLEAVKEDKDAALELFSDYLFSENAKNTTQIFLAHAKKTFDKENALDQFVALTQAKIEKSFWNTQNPNYSSAINLINMFGSELLFNQNEIKFVDHFTANITKIPADSESNAFKIVEFFFSYAKTPIEIEGKSDEICEKSSTHSYLIAKILENIKNIDSFDAVFALLRCSASLFKDIFNDEIIESLFTEKDSKLKQFLTAHLPHHMIVLLISIISRSNTEAIDYCYNESKKLILKSHEIIERVFGFTALSQIVKFVASKDDFLDLLVDCMFRDIDSNNHLITSTIKTILNSIFKTMKDDLPRICAHMMHRIDHLDWNAKLKTWLLPQLLPYLDTKDFDPTQLIIIAQNLSDATFVTKCIRSYAHSEESCENILHATINYVKSIPIEKDLPSLRPLFDPMFDVNPKFVKKAFDEFKEIKETHTRVWLMFEASRAIVKSKWVLNQTEIFENIKFGLQSLNWDIRATAFDIFMLAGMPQNQEEANLVVDNFENMLYMDSPKHCSMITSTMSCAMEGYSAGKNRFKVDEIIKPFLAKILDILDTHMIPSFITSHKQFCLDLNSLIIAKFPDLETDSHLLSLGSLLLDNSLTKSVTEVIRKRMTQSESTEKYFKEIKNERVQKNLFAQTDVAENENLKVREGLPASEQEFKEYLAKIPKEEMWEKQVQMLSDINESIRVLKHVISVETIKESADQIFELLVNTRKLGVACQGQEGLQYIVECLPPKELTEICDKWTDQIISILGGFDMKNMRRSAALPLIALTIIRVQTSDVMKMNGSKYQKLIEALISSIKTTENCTEATNALNVCRAVLTDKATSIHGDSIVPYVMEAILDVLRRLGGWEVVAAGNLCLSAVIRKLTKIGTLQNGKYLTLEQFFAKMSKVRDSMISSLQANKHSVYVALTILTQFEASETDEELQKLSLKHIGDRDCRLRRAAARACYMCTSRNDRLILFKELINSLYNRESIVSIQSYNTLHGVFDLMREIVSDEGFVYEDEFPTLDFKKIPPFIWSDIIIVMQKLKLTIPDVTDFTDNEFTFDESSLASLSSSSSTYSQRMMTAISLRNSYYPKDFPENVIKVVLGKSALQSVQNTCLSFAVQRIQNNHNINSDPLIEMIKNEDRPMILADLISLLSSSEKIPKSVIGLNEKFEQLSFILSEAMTPVHISIAKLLPKIINLDTRFALSALRLAIDEIPAVRVPASSALSDFVGSENKISEISSFRLAAKKISEMDSSVVARGCLKWASLVDEKSRTDTHGEQLTVLVDEFFFGRELCKALQVQIPFSDRQAVPLVEMRDKYKSAIISEVEKKYINKD
ncbi:hypothetical protein TVAG_474940 [Trichomonas vaginalis G3]|uniref:DUF2428 domain-containing protein n=1 Tax=Trichomonas vaginalis (strain ATCC PRA-98 / G3) TaxID=412133 RepID=A2ERP4_TRIV3|nr:putative death-receptor fusion protein (DUF2428) family [Trichomonas vaginalis G3]EAY04696.1 hypothetical protein TVAG_474940 [Trichomonas vaginalis G3]KAI5530894.1 putative death-receptor fusion protein (DUF2428) family [Trichomonas vaginalis G3]|eukprot:XP_001316919.1 hypothetical protein [Trichomonas vaginalis G3]